jgi:tricorn protease
LVFTAEGDLWLSDLKTGEAWRVTSDPGVETNAHFSPDGTQIAFTGSYEGWTDVYMMPVAGGIPNRLTYDPTDENILGPVVLDWTPDGKNVLFRTSGKMYGPSFEQEVTQELYTVAAIGGLPTRLPVPRGAFASFHQDGHTLAYVPTSNEWMNWSRYEGGEADQIWLADLQSGKFSKLTESKDVETQPVWVGKTIYFVSERTGVRNLWKLDPATKKASQVTFSKDLPVRYPATDGKRIVFQLGPKLEIYDPATGTATVPSIHLHSDRIHARAFEAPVEATDASSPSPDGKRVAILARGHLVTVAAGDGPMHILVSDSGQRAQNPAWSPDGKSIAYISDASGEEQVYTVADLEGATPRQITHDLTGEHGVPAWSPDSRRLLIGNRSGDIQIVDVATGIVHLVAHSLGQNNSGWAQGDYIFSPDSRWVAYSVSLGWRLNTVFLYEVATGKSTQVSDENIDSTSPGFSADGRYLYMLQSRNLTQSWVSISGRMSHNYAFKVTGITLAAGERTPFNQGETAAETTLKPGQVMKVDLNGIRDRYFDMKVAAGQYDNLLVAPGRLFLQSGSTILSFKIADQSLTTPVKDGHFIQLSPDLKNLLVNGSSGLQVVDAESGSAEAVNLTGLSVTVDPLKEWRQIFYESWRVGRDFFYDPNMLGINWKQIEAKYEAQLPLVASRYDLTLLTRDMVSELNTGHSFAGARSEFVGKSVKPGVLGIDLAWDGQAGAYKITRILRGNPWDPEVRSPLAEPGVDVKEGDFLLKIRGTALTKDQDPAAILVGTAGRKIEVTVGSAASPRNGRTLIVTPLANDSALRRNDWVASRRAYVERVGGGQIAYVYLSDMGSQGAAEFAEQYYPNVNRPGIIIDIRGNDGGNISGNVLNDLGTKVMGFFSVRGGGLYRRESWAPLGQVVAITNGYAFSDADYFSEFFKRFKIGPLVGARTTGGVVGSNRYTLVDGGGVSIPNYGAWVDGEWVAEGRGAIPDYEVDQDPAAVMAGRDPQLEKAVEVISARIKEHPLKPLNHPPYPVKLGGSRG